MYKNKKSLVWLLILLFIFQLIPYQNVKATDNINILSESDITVESAKEWARSKGATDTFINLADLFWRYAPERGGVNPALAYAQSALETGYGKFGGVLDESYKNPCGMKETSSGNNDDYVAEAHKKFNSWDDGIKAQLDHLALYAGANGYPRRDTTDPRHFSYLYGQATTALSLSNKWAGGDYGQKVLNLYNSLLDFHINSSSHGSLETPTLGNNIKSNTLNIIGWVISPKGVDEVKVYIDNIYLDSIKCNIERADIAKIYPKYNNAKNSGYKGNVDITKIPNGKKELKIEAIKNGNVVKVEKTNINIDKPKAIQCIDSPVENSNISTSSFTVSGWTLNYSGVKEVKVYVDSVLQGKATLGLSRDDVKSIYPQYLNADKSGFKFDVDSYKLAGGTREIMIEQIGNDGSIDKLVRKINIDKLSPIGCIDSPINNSVIGLNNIEVRGWALNASKIAKVEIYVDNVYNCDASIGIDRPDVGSIYSKYPNANKSGYSAKVSLKNISAGTRKISVKQIGIDGTSIFYHTQIKVDKLLPIQCVDSPTRGTHIYGDTMTVTGWSINSVGIKNIEVYIDNKLLGTTNVGISRLDVASVYPLYENASKSGYSINVNIANISGGNKKLKVVQTDVNNQKFTSEVDIYVAKLSNITVCDTPSNNESINGNLLNVSGWALNPNGIEKINIYIDNKLVSKAQMGIIRKDVLSVYPNYKNDSSGYKADIDISNIANGKRMLRIEQIGKYGSFDSIEKIINIQKAKPIVWIDTPRDNRVESGDQFTVSGWAISYSKIQSVNIYVDNVLIKQTKADGIRNDVNAVYPMYPNSKNSGYSAIIDTSKIKSGIRNVKVEIVCEDSTKWDTQSSVNIKKAELITCIDTPVSNECIKDDKISISGWALNPSGVKKVQAYVGEKLLSETQTNIYRGDVQAVYPQYGKNYNCGFKITDIDLTEIPPGNTVIEVRQVGNDGSISSTNVTIKIVKKQPLMCIDYPTSSYLEKGDFLRVRGWTLNASGVKEVAIYVDDNIKSTLSPNIVRDDVNTIYPGYKDGKNSGYDVNINLTGLAYGAHVLTVAATGYDGSINKISTKFFYKEKKTLIVLDPGHNQGGDYGAVSTHNGITYDETQLNMIVAIKVKAQLEAKGYTVALTRSISDVDKCGVTESLQKRAKLANSLNADLFISIHHNSATAVAASGSEVFYTTTQPDEGFPGHSIGKEEMSRNLSERTANSISNRTGFLNRGSKNANYYVLRNTQMPSILVECGFISNSNEAAILATDSNQQATAVGIAEAVKELF